MRLMQVLSMWQTHITSTAQQNRLVMQCQRLHLNGYGRNDGSWHRGLNPQDVFRMIGWGGKARNNLRLWSCLMSPGPAAGTLCG